MNEKYMKIGRVVLFILGIILVVGNVIWFIFELNQKSFFMIFPLVAGAYFAAQLVKMTIWFWQKEI